jgi:hypothetical protein
MEVKRLARLGDGAMRHLTYAQAVCLLAAAFAVLIFVLAAHGMGFVK